MNKKILNNNIVLAYAEETKTSHIPTDPLKTLAVSVYSDQSPNPVVVSMPDFSTILVPEVNVSLFLQNSAIVTTDQKIGDFSAKDVEKFIQFTKGVETKVGKALVAYGYNFLYEAEADEFEVFKQAFNKFFEGSTGAGLEGATLSYGIPNLVYELSGGGRLRLSFAPVLEPATSQELNRLQISGGIHYSKTALIEDLGEAATDYKDREKEISDYIDLIFS